MFVDFSGSITRAESNAKLSHTIRLLFTEPLSTEFIAGKLAFFFRPLPEKRYIYILNMGLRLTHGVV